MSNIEYKVNQQFNIKLGFEVSHIEVLAAVENTNAFLCSLPSNLYGSIDFKTTGAMIGAIFCSKLVEQIPNSAVNPIEKGHPDIIPLSGIGFAEEVLRNYPIGLEIKSTIGNLKTGANLRAGIKRIHNLTGITWQAHHREVNHLMGIIWDFVNLQNGFYYPAITGVFFSNELHSDDWGEISGTIGRNTKVTGMRSSGKQKMGKGMVLIYNDKEYIERYSRLLNIASVE
jgi:hypothetical protein